MANQNFRERVFFANGQKAVTTEDSKHPKNTQNTFVHKKGPKRVKIINIEIFAILYFSRMEFKSRKSRKIDAQEKTRFTVYRASKTNKCVSLFIVEVKMSMSISSNLLLKSNWSCPCNGPFVDT